MTNEQIKEQALALLKRSIRVSEWRNTDMGSGYEFSLNNPFAITLWDQLTAGAVLIERLFLDEYEGIDEEDEPFFSEVDKLEHFKEHQQCVYDWGYQSTLDEAIEKYSYKFEEFILQATEISEDYGKL